MGDEHVCTPAQDCSAISIFYSIQLTWKINPYNSDFSQENIFCKVPEFSFYIQVLKKIMTIIFHK